MPRGVVALLTGMALLMLLTLGLVLAMALGVITPPGMSADPPAETSSSSADASNPAEAEYVALEQPLTVNLEDADEGPAEHLEAEVELAADSEEVLTGIERHEAAIRDELMLFLAEQSFSSLSEGQGREVLQDEALERVNGVLEEHGVDGQATGLYFTRLVMQ
ncbi:MAG: flagellar basal body-associated protein FliL [Halorhodospira sp.]